uniref:Uncharacterized protein n=1 Tax=Chromera velia CCMP2878 TaxID=1169474 RepID=A0A0G4H8U6_9ALVE|eukprot:Cvel_5880.t1-p1 / transcript=Cvel_5880.t1 / gene=Cvel_5880 / organism=Chromera_velia_CCMP2878 / gene_product=Putative ankyrin repeat protein MM_0045, putative / transcript_product=Putative ankyrin repeat protein MM_0045, putative / location=Cvel_scaffold280:31814-34590(-) / protein_length=782 / sequence_SO=supercontig / SO=protein_coding / is_pseudo=false
MRGCQREGLWGPDSVDDCSREGTQGLLVRGGGDLTQALTCAAERGQAVAADLLIRAGADVNARFPFVGGGGMPLIAAATKGHTEVVDLLIRVGADVSVKDREGRAVLVVAAENGHSEVVNLLIRAGSIHSAEAAVGGAALMSAVEKGHCEVADLLIRAGVNVNVEGRAGGLPLMLAAENGDREVVDLLLRAGADVNAKDQQTRPVLMVAAERGHARVVDSLIRACVDVNATRGDGSTALVAASAKGWNEVVDLLLRAGADVNAKDFRGWTALMIAAEEGHCEVTACLLQGGGDPDITSQSGESAISLALQNTHTEVLQLFESKAETQREWKPLATAFSERFIALWPLSVLRFLLDKGRPVPRRQDVPSVLQGLGMPREDVEAATNSADQFAQLDCPLRGAFTVVCLSYGWLSREHPDPNLFHLRLLVEECERHWWGWKDKSDRTFVFWDYMAIPQRSRGHSGEIEENEENEFSQERFDKALSRLDLLYSSPHTRVFRSTGTPPDAHNSAPFDQRGWTTFETFLTGFKFLRMIHNLPTGTGPDPRAQIEDERTVSPTPAAPLDFDRVIDGKTFTNNSDVARVKRLYRQFVRRTVSRLREISFAGQQFFDASAVRRLARLLDYLSQLPFQSKGQEDAGEEEEQAVGRERCLSHLCSLERLDLRNTKSHTYVDVLKSLKNAERLRVLNLSGNAGVGAPVLRALHKNLEMRGMAGLEEVYLQECEYFLPECGALLIGIADLADGVSDIISTPLTIHLGRTPLSLDALQTRSIEKRLKDHPWLRVTW